MCVCVCVCVCKPAYEHTHLFHTHAASQSESKTLSDNVSSLLSQLEAEKASHQDSMSKLQREAEEGGRQVTRLQQQLDMCKKELGQCLHQVEGEMSLFRKEEEGYKQQVRGIEKRRLGSTEE